MREKHPQTEIAPYLRGDLSAAERDRLASHLARCDRCRADADAYAAVLKTIAADAARIPAPDWRAYRAELHRKLAARRNLVPGVPSRSWNQRLRWASIGTAVAAAAVLLFLTILPHPQPGAPSVDQMAMEDAMGGADIGLLRNYPVVEHLDLLENYDVIEHLDEVAPTDTSDENPS